MDQQQDAMEVNQEGKDNSLCMETWRAKRRLQRASNARLRKMEDKPEDIPYHEDDVQTHAADAQKDGLAEGGSRLKMRSLGVDR